MNTREFFSELYQGIPPEKVTYCYTLPRKKCEPFLRWARRRIPLARSFPPRQLDGGYAPAGGGIRQKPL